MQIHCRATDVCQRGDAATTGQSELEIAQGLAGTADLRRREIIGKRNGKCCRGETVISRRRQRSISARTGNADGSCERSRSCQ